MDKLRASLKQLPPLYEAILHGPRHLHQGPGTKGPYHEHKGAGKARGHARDMGAGGADGSRQVYRGRGRECKPCPPIISKGG